MEKKNNSIIDSLKRLERVGSETSRVTEKLKTACNEVAKKIVSIMKSECEDEEKNGFRGEYSSISLPRGYRLILIDTTDCHMWTLIVPSQDERIDHPYNRSLAFVPQDITRDDALQFSKDIAEGLLDEITVVLESEKNQMIDATKEIEQAVENNKE